MKKWIFTRISFVYKKAFSWTKVEFNSSTIINNWNQCPYIWYIYHKYLITITCNHFHSKDIHQVNGLGPWITQLLVQNIYHDFGSQKMEWQYFHKQNQIYYCLKFNLISFTAKSNFSTIHCNLTWISTKPDFMHLKNSIVAQ